MHFRKIYESMINELIQRRVKTEADLASFKREISKKYQIPLPSNIQLLKAYHNLLKLRIIKNNGNLENLLKKRKIRSLSGVVVVSVLTKPYPCPGKCIYCPTEKGIPKSYLSGEPAVERAKRFNYSPYLQVKKRIEMLKAQGHPTDKIELRIIGATFSAYPENYKIWFLANCFAAANQRNKIAKKNINWKILEREQKINEKTKQRIVGISIETRPDFINEKEISNLRKLGITMVELGVQTIFDDVLKKCQRGHGIKETILATKLLKNAGFKIMYQMMPNLPGSNLKRDLECFKKVFNNKNFKPDWLKIYPTVVCKGSKLYQIWKKGKYKSYSDKDLIELLIKIKKNLPYWIRLTRLFRDIPRQKIVSGCKISNLREVVRQKMKEKGLKCKCIRCREIKEKYDPKEKIYLFREDYNASAGREIFLSYENPATEPSIRYGASKKRTKLYSFLRLRIPAQCNEARPRYIFPRYIFSILKGAAIIREIQTYGQVVPLGEKSLAPQHRGLGKKLIKEAEKIAKKEFGLKKIAVISGVGVRKYFGTLGYKLKNTYMIKWL